MSSWVFGRRSVQEHLEHAPDTARRLLVARGGRVPRAILDLAASAGVPVEEVPRQVLERRAGGPGHQGVALEVGGWSYQPLEALVERALAPGAFPLLIALDCVQDPRNLGAVLRVADGVGAAGVVIPKDRSAGLGPGAARTASGALAAVPVARVVNLARALDDLRERGFWIYGAAGGQGEPLYGADLPLPAVLVLGGEHKGLRPNVATRCDRLVSIPMAGAVASLNVAVACGVLCYELLRRHGHAAGAR